MIYGFQVTERSESRRATPIAAALLLLAALLISSANAAELRLTFNIAPGPLQPALDRLAEQTGLQLLYDPTVLEGRVTRGIAGAMPPKKALSELLANTDIAFNFTADDAVALFRKSAPATPAGGNAFERSTQPRTVTISTNRSITDLYNSNMSMTATKVDESLLTIPLTSESLSQGVLRDLQVNRLEDALEYVSGTEVAPNGQSALGFLLRGFPTYQYYLDGVRVSPDLHHDGFRDLTNVERIEVVKGPASLLYGRTEPGGAINIITKQPLSEPHISLEQQVGSFRHQRTEIDAGGPVMADRTLLYRFNAAYEDQHTFRDLPANHRIFLAPVVTWNSSALTSTTLYAEYLDSHDFHDSGLPVIKGPNFGWGPLPAVPVGRSLESGGEIHTTDIRIGIKGSHVFADGWIIRHHLDARWVTSPQLPEAALSDDGLDSTGCTPARCPVNRELVSIPESHGHTYFASLDARRDFNFWGVRHSVLTGLDLFASNENTELLLRSDPSLAVDLFNPVPAPVPWTLLQNPESDLKTATSEEWVGLYVQEQMQIGDSLHVLLGARFDHVHENVDNSGFTPLPGISNTLVGDDQSNKVQALKGRAGVVWHPLQPLSLYANFSQNFGITAGLFESGNAETQLLLPAELAQEWETGLKFESPQGRVSATLAWFNLYKRNISTPVLAPALDSSSISFLMHGARNEGLEADFRGEIFPGLQLLASYAYIDSRIIGGEGFGFGAVPKNAELVGSEGDRLSGVPRHGGSVWATYHLDGGALRGMKFGLGAIIRGDREGDNANDYRLASFTKVGALAAYSWRTVGTDFDVQLNVDNLFNARYFESLSGTHTVMPGAPRRWIATVRASF
ncbi:MAG: iron complex outerrane recepter protein [Gammaproteobacteria bacterium]|nr:iron complex outerrane recepter protein [Gammaproteobacteria bacterium]